MSNTPLVEILESLAIHWGGITAIVLRRAAGKIRIQESKIRILEERIKFYEEKYPLTCQGVRIESQEENKAKKDTGI